MLKTRTSSKSILIKASTEGKQLGSEDEIINYLFQQDNNIFKQKFKKSIKSESEIIPNFQKKKKKKLTKSDHQSQSGFVSSGYVEKTLSSKQSQIINTLEEKGIITQFQIDTVTQAIIESEFKEKSKDSVEEIIDCLINKKIIDGGKREQIIEIVTSEKLVKKTVSSKLNPTSSSNSDNSSRSAELTRQLSQKITTNQRFTTLMGKQGEHVSAYTLYVELVLSILETTNTKHALNDLKNGLACINVDFNSDQKRKLEELYEEYEKQQDQDISQEKRSFVSTALGVYISSSEGVEEAKKLGIKDTLTLKKDVRYAIRNSNRADLQKILEERVETVLRAANKMAYVSFPVQGGKKTPIRNEGTLKNDLRALNDFLLDFCESSLESALEIHATKLKYRKVERGYGYAGYHFADPEKQKKVKSTSDKKKTKKSNPPSSKMLATPKFESAKENKLLKDRRDKIESQTNSLLAANKKEFVKEVADKINLLFWYPRIDENELIPKDNWGKKAQTYGYNKQTAFRTNDLEILYQVTARHIVLIFNCYQGLTYLPTEIQEGIVNRFLKYVLATDGNKDYGQGWKNNPDWEKLEENDVINKFKEGIAQYADLNYNDGEFRMEEKDSYTEDEVSSSHFISSDSDDSSFGCGS